MKIGACLGWGDFSKYEFAKACGLDYAETDFADIARADEKEFDEFCEKIKKLDLPVLAANHFLPPEINIIEENVNSDKLIGFLSKGFERVSRLGIESIVFGSGKARSYDEATSKEKATEVISEFLEKNVAPHAEKYNVNVVIEPLSFGETNMIHTVKDAVYFAEKADFNHIYALADLFHVCNNNDDIDGIGDFKGKVKHAHIAEPQTRIFPNKKADASVNDIYKRFFAALNKVGCETLTIEARTDNFKKDLVEAIDVLKGIFGSL